MKRAGIYDTRPFYFAGNDEVDTAALLAAATSDEARAKLRSEISSVETRSEAMRQNMSGPRELRLPALLDQRRLEWLIPDQYFYCPASYDWVVLYQLPPMGTRGAARGTGIIIAPDQTQDIERRTASRGVIVSAGLSALDYLSDHGMELGNIVHFVRLSPWVQDHGMIHNEQLRPITIKPGDICGCEDHFALLQSREMRLDVVETPDDQGAIERRHIYRKADGTVFSAHNRPPDQGDY